MNAERAALAEEYARAAWNRVKDAEIEGGPGLGAAALLNELRTAWGRAFAEEEAHESWKAAALKASDGDSAP